MTSGDQSRVRIELASLRKTSWSDYAIRFVFGGLITAVAGLIASKYGPVVGGLFLAFPAILPASMTLVEKHDGKRKAQADTKGSAVGAVGLLAFGAVVWLLAGRLPAWLVLGLALLAWLCAAVGLWVALRDRLADEGPG